MLWSVDRFVSSVGRFGRSVGRIGRSAGLVERSVGRSFWSDGRSDSFVGRSVGLVGRSVGQFGVCLFTVWLVGWLFNLLSLLVCFTSRSFFRHDHRRHHRHSHQSQLLAAPKRGRNPVHSERNQALSRQRHTRWGRPLLLVNMSRISTTF